MIQPWSAWPRSCTPQTSLRTATPPLRDRACTPSRTGSPCCTAPTTTPRSSSRLPCTTPCTHGATSDPRLLIGRRRPIGEEGPAEEGGTPGGADPIPPIRPLFPRPRDLGV